MSQKVERRQRPGASRVRIPVWFVIPALAVYGAITLWPNIQGLFYSFTNWDGFGAVWDFVGVQNFIDVLTDSSSLRAIGNTLLLTLIVTVMQNLLGLVLALGLNTTVKSRYVLRLVFFLPVVLTPIVAGFLWKYLLSPTGTVNTVLDSMGLHSLAQDWLGNPNIALFSICAAIIWQGTGYSMVIYLAGLQGIPEDLLEAASLDGAGAWRRTFSVVIPLLNGSIVINVLLALTGNLKQFDTVYAMTNGGPAGSTETMATIVYKTAFQYNLFPTALAQGVLLTLIVGVIAVTQYRLTQRKADLT
ncbi:Lactose transport system permease protein LacF [Microbacterium sp. Bi98]|uniref:carbohydrate ABC transporter permease n=1 Tax=Microbacterium sp. Bi98 TaxID=2821116 RepID=UPI001D96BF87|nr:sugar ABC transporter permease [Microbacterium sp. Bi98]CAH0123795.1 Lactose transport system permease protein LacF [Microbacterium sp. Bi98]